MTETIEGFPIEEIERAIENWSDDELPDQLRRATIDHVAKILNSSQNLREDIENIPVELLQTALERYLDNNSAALNRLERGRRSGKFPRDPMRPRGVADKF